MKNIFADLSPIYRMRGFQPRPIKPGTKSCYERGWPRPDIEIPLDEFDRWLAARANFGIGLLMGSDVGDGTKLGALDIDRNEYRKLGETLLGVPTCGRIGKKGAVFFVRVAGVVGNPEFKVPGTEWGKVAECLFSKKICVIPPTIHPETRRPYEWIGQSLLDVDLKSLPLVEA